MTILIQPTYFPSISHFVAIAKSAETIFEIDDNFQKQTNRNRMYIYSPNGLQLLNIPVKHSKESHQKTRDIQIETAFGWQKQHFKSLEAAYRSSPFFEYFEDAISTIFTKEYKFLLDLNLETIEVVCKCLGISPNFSKTSEYFHEVVEVKDLRFLANGKRDTSDFEPYKQV
ncbi:MAG TPA: WbqC family protein, partial [Flavobacterium sp.]